jgi:hypothetical protein
MRTESILDASGWRYSLDEFSTRLYRVRAEDGLGRRFEASGFDPDVLLQRAKEHAIELSPPKAPPVRGLLWQAESTAAYVSDVKAARW